MAKGRSSQDNEWVSVLLKLAAIAITTIVGKVVNDGKDAVLAHINESKRKKEEENINH